ncbi:glycosyltransferase family 4 protein [Flavobacteriaceae bacterium]|nr:glycosyltransferase family 4 protein [Flavobacteriaceae bacterium]
MKILQINNIHYIRGGADVVYFETGKLLEKYGHQVFYFSSRGEKTLSNENLNYFYQEFNHQKASLFEKVSNIKSFVYNDKSYKSLLKYIDIVKPDVAHVHLFMGGGSVSILKALREKGIPIIHSVHDYRLICPASLLLDNKNNICELCKDGSYLRCTTKKCAPHSFSKNFMLSMDAYFRKKYLRPLNFINHFIFVSHFSRNKHIEFEKEYRFKSSVLYNFIENFKKNKNKIIKGDYFIYFGRLSREKGIATLIEAATLSDINLKIVGEGPLYDDCKKLNLKKIDFIGFKQGEELRSLVRNSSFVIVPSEVYESLGMVIIEAYALGKPVIASRIGGIPEIVDNGNTGLLFELKSVKDLTKKINIAESINHDEYLQMSNNAIKFARTHFDSKKYYNELIKIYKNATDTVTVFVDT